VPPKAPSSVAPLVEPATLETTPTAKKKPQQCSQNSSLAKKRRVLFANSTPVKQFLSNVVPSESSPTIAVSLTVLLLMVVNFPPFNSR